MLSRLVALFLHGGNRFLLFGGDFSGAAKAISVIKQCCINDLVSP
jgi:hypothetical protein